MPPKLVSHLDISVYDKGARVGAWFAFADAVWPPALESLSLEVGLEAGCVDDAVSLYGSEELALAVTANLPPSTREISVRLTALHAHAGEVEVRKVAQSSLLAGLRGALEGWPRPREISAASSDRQGAIGGGFLRDEPDDLGPARGRAVPAGGR